MAPTDSRSDAIFVAAAQQGDRAALATLLERHYDRVRAVCARIAGSTRDGEDAAQEAMIRIVRSLGSFDGRAAFGTWAYRIASNAAIDELRRRKRRGELRVVDDEGFQADLADPSANATIDMMGEQFALDAALRSVPEEFRVPVVLRDVGDLDYEQIAATLNIPLGTVKSRIARGRRMLRDQIEAGNQADPPQRPRGEMPSQGDHVLLDTSPTDPARHPPTSRLQPPSVPLPTEPHRPDSHD